MFRQTIKLLTASAIAISFLWLGVSAAQQGAKPVKENTVHMEFIEPPPTLNETFLATDLIVRGRIAGTTPRDKAHPDNRGTWIRTGHRFTVLEVFRAPKGPDLTNREIVVIQSGGERDRGNHVERLAVERFPLLKNGREYVLFRRQRERIGDLPTVPMVFLRRTAIPSGLSGNRRRQCASKTRAGLSSFRRSETSAYREGIER